MRSQRKPRTRFIGRISQLLVLAFLGTILLLIVFITRLKASAESDSPEQLELSLTLFASGLDSPVSIANAGAGDGRLFVNEREGRIRIILPDGTVLPEPFLDITDQVISSGEGGLLGLAFHPNYSQNGFFYVNYTNRTNNIWRTRISRFKVSDNPNNADEGNEEILLTVMQPGTNHNAGDIHFGPDGFLYIPLGDGGHGSDPNNSQDLKTLLGKVIRIDVDVDSQAGNAAADCQGNGTGNYKIPSTNTTAPKNPFIDGPGGNCDEIWALGLRNPWRSSFDKVTGEFYIGDVGQNAWEEIDFQEASSMGGENYGWRCFEGNHPVNTNGCGPMTDYDFPILEYGNPDDGCSVTGGYVYRGSKYATLVGRYFLTDYCSGNFWDLIRSGDTWQATKHTNMTAFGFVTFGEDINGELYVANISSGNIYRLEGMQIDLEVAGYLPLLLN